MTINKGEGWQPCCPRWQIRSRSKGQDMTKLATITCRALGILFVAIGLATFVFGEQTDRYHNVMHFVTGLIALVAGFAGSRSAARIFCLAFGVGYLALGSLGFVAGRPESEYLWDLRVMHLDAGDHVFHLVLGSIVLLGGILGSWSGPQGIERKRATKGRSERPGASRIVVASLVAAAVGVATMIVSGVEFTTSLPPGLLILLLPAGLVAFGPWRWTPIVATLAGLFIVVSYFPSGSAAALFEPGRLGIFAGLWLQFVGSAVAVVAGIVATKRNYRSARQGQNSRSSAGRAG
jgi:hypothetical protein